MSDLQITVTVNDHEYTREQLDRYEYERTLHGLHEMLRLGAELRDEQGNPLTHTDLNWLEPERAKAISYNFRTSLTEQQMLELMEPVSSDAARRWKEFNTTPIEEQGYQHATTEISFRGVSLPEALQAMAGFHGDTALAAMPEHYVVVGSITEGQHGMEPFGMFGEAPLVGGGVASQEIPELWGVRPSEGYDQRVCGEFLLFEDGTPIHFGTMHEFKPVEDGVDMRSTCVAPANAPTAIVEGHTIHFAIEITNMLRNTYQALHNN